MDEISVDVRTGEERIRRFMPEEEARRLLEIEAALEQERVEHLAHIKTRLLDAVANLGSAKTLETEGVLTVEDVAEVKAQVNALKFELAASLLGMILPG